MRNADKIFTNTAKSSNEETNAAPGDTAAPTNAAPHDTGAANTSQSPTEAAPDAAAPAADHQRNFTARKSNAANPKQRNKPNGERQNAGAKKHASTSHPSLRDRLLAPITVPSLPLDRKLLPDVMVGALDAAGLGHVDLLPASALMMLAGAAAVAGPHLRFANCADPKLDMLGTGSSLRIAVIGDHGGPFVPDGIMAALYAVENDFLAVHKQSSERLAALRRVSAERRRLFEQASRATAALGLAPPAALPVEEPLGVLAPPRIVIRDGAGSAVVEAAAGGTGVLVIDERWVKSMLVGANRDKPTANLLNALALGHAVPVPQANGRTEMLAFPAAVVGGLAPGDCLSQQLAGRDQLAATMFVKAARWPVGGNCAELVALLCRVAAVTQEPRELHLPAKARQALAATAVEMKALELCSVAPLCDFIGGLPDLARRLAGLLHVVEAAATGAAAPPREISIAAVNRAGGLVKAFVLPMAQAWLGPASCSEAERDARTMIGYLRQTSAKVAIERRLWMRNWQNLMPNPRFPVALDLLLQEKLLSPTKGDNGGQWYAASPDIHDGA